MLQSAQEDDCAMRRMAADGEAGGLVVVAVRLETPTLGKLVLQCWVGLGVAGSYPVQPPLCVLRGATVTDDLLVNMTSKLQEKALAMCVESEGEPFLYSLVEALREDDSWLIAGADSLSGDGSSR